MAHKFPRLPKTGSRQSIKSRKLYIWLTPLLLHAKSPFGTWAQDEEDARSCPSKITRITNRDERGTEQTSPSFATTQPLGAGASLWGFFSGCGFDVCSRFRVAERVESVASACGNLTTWLLWLAFAVECEQAVFSVSQHH